MKYLKSEDCIEKFDDKLGKRKIDPYLYKKFGDTRNIRLLLRVTGLKRFSYNPKDKRYYSVGAAGKRRSSKDDGINTCDYESIFNFGLLKGSHYKCLPNYFRLAVIVILFPEEGSNFYFHCLYRASHARGGISFKKASASFVIDNLDIFKKERLKFMNNNIIKCIEPIKDAVRLLAYVAVQESNDHHYKPKPDIKKYNEIRNFLKNDEN